MNDNSPWKSGFDDLAVPILLSPDANEETEHDNVIPDAHVLHNPGTSQNKTYGGTY